MPDRCKTSPPSLKIIASAIHGQGLAATRTLHKNTRIIEYRGERITKEESERRAWQHLEQAKQDGSGTVYIFELNDEYDIDGDCPENLARLINHSCDPNCESESDGEHIWIVALRTIAKGEELTFDYGYDLDQYRDHPCQCGSAHCIGYIVRSDLRAKLKLS